MTDDIKQKTFKEWIMYFVDQPNPYGDLARDIKDDKDFPETNKKSDIERHMDFDCTACMNAMITLDEVFEDYEKYLKHSINIKNN